MGGHLGLDLVNTVEPRFETADRREHLVDPDALLVWAQRVRLVSDPAAGSIRTAWSKAPRAAVRALHEVIEIREALYAVLRFHLVGETRRSESPDGELEFLAQRYAAALGRSELRLQTRSGPADPSTGPGPSARVTGSPAVTATRLVIGSSPGSLIPDRVVGTSVELICETDLSPLRSCPEGEGGCGWLFLDHSRNHSRRWCEIGGECATQAKVRRLTERRRAARRRAVKG